MDAWQHRDTGPRIPPLKRADQVRAALVRTYEEAEHARSCLFWQGHECNCFLDDVARALGRDRRI
jgi:hypothetical protein